MSEVTTKEQDTDLGTQNGTMSLMLKEGDVPKELREKEVWTNENQETIHKRDLGVFKEVKENGEEINLYYENTLISIDKELKQGLKEITKKEDIETRRSQLLLLLDNYTENKGQNKYQEIRVADLRAELVGEEVQINVQVAGDQRQKAIPKEFKEVCLKCGWEGQIHDIKENPQILKNYLLGSKKDWQRIVSPYECPSCERKDSATYEELENTDFAILHVRDLLESHNKFEESSYETNKVYLVGETIPNSKKVTIRGEVVREPKTNDLSIIATEIEPYEDILEDFDLTDKDKKDFEKYFQEKNIEKIKPQIAPDMVGRPFVQKSRLLVLHSIAEIPFLEGKIKRGCLREVLFGDTTTYKSASIEDIIEEFGLGSMIHGNTSKRTGLLYTIDSEKRTLIWGEIPLNDLGYIGLDEMHSLHSEDINQLRSALRDQTVKVNQMVSGEAKTRFRASSTLNPGKGEDKPMNEYLYNCQAIKDTYVFKDSPDIARWDIFIPFSNDDVKPGEIADRDTKKQERPIPNKVFKKHIQWAWSRKPKDIKYKDETRAKIKNYSKKFIKKYSSSRIPIINGSFRKSLTRLSVAFASLNHSTDEEHEKVIVEPCHVDKSISFYEEMLDKLDYIDYIEHIEGNKGFTEAEFLDLIDNISRDHLKILESVSDGAKSSKELADKLDKVPKTIKRKYPELKEHELIRTKTGKGSEATAKGIRLLKKIKELPTKTNESDRDKSNTDSKQGSCNNIRDIGTKPVPNETNESTKNEGNPQEIDLTNIDESQTQTKNQFLKLLELENMQLKEAKKFFENREKDPDKWIQKLKDRGLIQEKGGVIEKIERRSNQ